MLCGAECKIGAQGGVAIGKALETNAALNDLNLCSESGRMARAATWQGGSRAHGSQVVHAMQHGGWVS